MLITLRQLLGAQTRNSILFINKLTYHSFVKMCSEVDKVYIRGKDNEDQFQVYFTFCDTELNINKPMNFNRIQSESVDVFLNRVSSKIITMLQDKQLKLLKKGRKKNADIPINDSFNTKKLNVQLLKNGTVIDTNLLCKEVFFTDLESLISMKILDKDYKVMVNSPWVHNITLPKTMMAGFPVYPVKFETLFTNKEESEYHWYRISPRCISKSNVVDIVGHDFIYIPTAEDIGFKLKLSCAPKNKKQNGPIYEVISDSTVEAGPGICPFEKRHEFTKDMLSGKKVVSYNILADLYATSEAGRTELFTYCPPSAISVYYRTQLLMKELSGYNADLICLQEVDVKLFENNLTNFLDSKDFQGVFSKKGGHVNEGVACFYRKSRFKLIESKGILLGKESRSMECVASIWDIILKNEVLSARVMERTTAVQVVTLEHIDTGNKIVLANTHLYFHPNADHIRLLQGAMAINFINDVVKSINQSEPNCKVSVVFAGDFNSTPDCGVYQLFTTNQVSSNCIDWNSKEGEKVTGLSLDQPLLLKSACGTPEFTNYTVGFSGCLDYIYYQPDYLEVKQVVPFPPIEEITKHIAIPSIVFPSDHVALVADLCWK